MGHIRYSLDPHHLRPVQQDFELDDNKVYSSPLRPRSHNDNGSAASRDTL